MTKEEFIEKIESFKNFVIENNNSKEGELNWCFMAANDFTKTFLAQATGNDFNLIFNLLEHKYSISKKTLEKMKNILIKEFEEME